MSSGTAWLRPFSVTVTFETVPTTPETTIPDGYRLAGEEGLAFPVPEPGIVKLVVLEKVDAPHVA